MNLVAWEVSCGQIGNIPAPPQSATSPNLMVWFRGKPRQLSREHKTGLAKVVSPNETEEELEIRGGRNDQCIFEEVTGR